MRIVTESRKASVSGIQRRLKICYNRAARLIETMEAAGLRMRTLRRSFALLFPVACFLSSGAAAQGPDLAALDAYIAQARKDWNIPGLSIGIVKNDSVVFLKGYGLRELGKPDPVTPNTLFAIGSNSKSFTAAAVGMLVDDLKMKFDDRVTKWLPDFQLFART